MTLSPDLALILGATATAAAMTPLGLIGSRRPGAADRSWIGWAQAVAAGMMLAMAFQFHSDGRPPAQLVGAMGSVGLLAFLQNRGRLVSLVAHSAFEGLAIGVAFWGDPGLGLFLCLVVGLHNLPETRAEQAAAIESGQGRGGLELTLARIPQILVALGTWWALTFFAGETPAQMAAGAATGALVFLVVAELLPAAYQRAGAPAIAVVASLSLSGVVLLGELLQ